MWQKGFCLSEIGLAALSANAIKPRKPGCVPQNEGGFFVAFGAAIAIFHPKLIFQKASAACATTLELFDFN